MAELSLRLKVFIASPGDLAEERRIAEAEIEAMARECSRHRLLLTPFLWEEDWRPGVGRPQAGLNDQLRSSELAVAMLWSRLGFPSTVNGEVTGALEEISVAIEQFNAGRSDDLFLYFKTAEAVEAATASGGGGAAASGTAGAGAAGMEKVREYRRTIDEAKSLLYGEISSAEDFRTKFRKHLRLWVERWYGVPEICQFALEHSPPGVVPPVYKGENRYGRLHRLFPTEKYPELTSRLGKTAVGLYQANGQNGYSTPVDATVAAAVAPVRDTFVTRFRGPLEDARTPLVEADGKLYFAGSEWFAYFCAAGLADAICEGRVEAVERLPYTNDVHQFLKVLAHSRRLKILGELRKWLMNSNDCTYGRPVARNFAAYVIGMLDGVEAQDDLARAIEDDGEDVQLYCITSLGKLRARRHLPVLARLFSSTLDLRIRLTAAQAVCKMVGIAHYEL